MYTYFIIIKAQASPKSVASSIKVCRVASINKIKSIKILRATRINNKNKLIQTFRLSNASKVPEDDGKEANI